MQAVRAAILAAAVAAFWVDAGAAADEQPPTGAEAGKIIFKTICVSCHGKDARGGGPVAESLKTKPADLHLIARRRSGSFPQDEIAQFIDGRKAPPAHGTREMPVWGDRLATAAPDAQERERRREQAIEQVVAYLKTIQD
jgi:mono/diheme cytochrome c family protein